MISSSKCTRSHTPPECYSPVMYRTILLCVALLLAVTIVSLSSTGRALAVSYPDGEVSWNAQPAVVRIVNMGYGHSRVSNAFTPGDEVETTCTGTYVATGFVLTAAHCIDDEYDEQFFIASGPENAHKLCAVIDTKLHPRYTKGYISANDVAILHTKPGCEPRTFPRLARRGTSLRGITLYGWGLNQNSQPSERLGKLRVTNEANLASSLYGDDFLPAIQIAAGRWFADEKIYAGACFGDSGGPLLAGRTLVGVVSWGTNYKKTCFPMGPTVFSRVSNYAGWVRSTMRELNTAGNGLNLFYNSQATDLGYRIGGVDYAIGLDITRQRTDIYFHADGATPPVTPNFQIFATGSDYESQRPSFVGDATGVYDAAGKLLCASTGDKSRENTRWITYPTSCLMSAGPTIQYLVLQTTPRQPLTSHWDLPADAITFPAVGLVG
jgi:hypothetical protein